MKKCTSCLLPETHETIKFNEKGSCNICTGIEYRDNEIDYSKKKIEPVQVKFDI